MAKYTGKLLKVVWHDACSLNGWSDAQIAAGISVPKAVTVGYCLNRDKRRVVMAATATSDGDVGEVIAIPRGMIKSVKRLK